MRVLCCLSIVLRNLIDFIKVAFHNYKLLIINY